MNKDKRWKLVIQLLITFLMFYPAVRKPETFQGVTAYYTLIVYFLVTTILWWQEIRRKRNS